jgi:psp operon transcriptional activator
MDRGKQFVGQSQAILDAVERASRAAALSRPVLVIGERGTGKELIAERLHHLSDRWGEPLVVMNCAALPETLIEAELFGHEAGAFTGASKARAGRFEEADGGTLFLDELGTLSMAAQERLLRAVEYGEVTRIGASRPTTVDVRIVAATNEDLPTLAERGEFRADLLDRLSFEVITLPPLRAREGDVVVIADFFGRRMAAELLWDDWPGFSDSVMEQLESYPWPGNG